MLTVTIPAWALAQSPASGPLLVMPLTNAAREPRVHWVQEASAVLLADALNARGVRALTRSERVTAFERMHLPARATLSLATVIRVGQMVGASEVIRGTLEVAGNELTVRARSVQIDTGRQLSEIVERGAISDLFGIFGRVAGRLAPRSIAPPPSSQPSFEAFENYIKGLIAEAPATQIKFLEAALNLYEPYDLARIALWEVLTAQGDHARALASVRGVAAGSPRAREARFHAALSQIALAQWDDAFAGLKALGEQAPAAAIDNNLGVIQSRRGSTPQTGRPTYYFNKAIEAEPTEPDYHFNLGYAYYLERDFPAAVYWLREAVRRNTADGDAHFVLGASLQATVGTNVEAVREKELARQLSVVYDEWQRRPGASGEQVPRGRERIKTQLDPVRASRVDMAIVTTAQREHQEVAAFHLDRGRRLYAEEKDREALEELRRSIFLLPYQAEAHLLVGKIYLRSAHAREAIDALKIAIWSEETAGAHVALADAYLQNGDVANARVSAQRALVLDPGSADAKALLERIEKVPKVR